MDNVERTLIGATGLIVLGFIALILLEALNQPEKATATVIFATGFITLSYLIGYLVDKLPDRVDKWK